MSSAAKRIFTSILITLILSCSTALSQAENAPCNQTVFSSEHCEIHSAEISDSTAFAPIRDALSLVTSDFSVEWDSAKSEAVITYTDASAGIVQEKVIRICAGNSHMISDGNYISLGKPCYIKQGELFVPLRKFLMSFNAYIVWNSESRSAIVFEDSQADDLLLLTEQNADLYWLSRIISAESRGEPFEGQIAVGNVILERMTNEGFPNSIHDVIFDETPVIQFTPVENKTVFDAPDPSCIAAAKLCLSGFTIQSTKGCLFFQNPDTTRSSWVSENRRFAAQIGAHAFYY